MLFCLVVRAVPHPPSLLVVGLLQKQHFLCVCLPWRNYIINIIILSNNNKPITWPSDHIHGKALLRIAYRTFDLSPASASSPNNSRFARFGTFLNKSVFHKINKTKPHILLSTNNKKGVFYNSIFKKYFFIAWIKDEPEVFQLAY